MPIRVEKDPMGMGGRAWYVSSPADIGSLPSDAASLVSRRVSEFFEDPPRALGEMAAKAPLPSMRRWLESLVDARCVLEVYATSHYDRESRLRFDFGSGWAPSFRLVAGKP